MEENALALMVNDLRKDYGKGECVTHALNGVNLTVQKGEFMALMGASGSGKSTLLNIVATMDKKRPEKFISMAEASTVFLPMIFLGFGEKTLALSSRIMPFWTP